MISGRGFNKITARVAGRLQLALACLSTWVINEKIFIAIYSGNKVCQTLWAFCQ